MTIQTPARGLRRRSESSIVPYAIDNDCYALSPTFRGKDGSCQGAEPAPVAVDWNARAPRGLYVLLGRPLLQAFLLALVLPLSMPALLAVALANLILFRDPRRVFFVQPRVGYRGRVFRMFKFRTMREAPGGALSSWRSGDDSQRVTPFGRFLRNSHLDELPQLFNVLRGEMGFIGPRPEMIGIEEWAEACIPGFTARLAIRPGLTGLAQITQGYTGHDVHAYARKLAINEHYLGRITLAGDLKILFLTALWVVRGRGWKWKPKGAPTTAQLPARTERRAA